MVYDFLKLRQLRTQYAVFEETYRRAVQLRYHIVRKEWLGHGPECLDYSLHKQAFNG